MLDRQYDLAVAHRIAALRRKQQRSQQQMADELHMSRAGYGSIELGRATPSPARLKDIAAILGVSVSALFPPRPKQPRKQDFESDSPMEVSHA